MANHEAQVYPIAPPTTPSEQRWDVYCSTCREIVGKRRGLGRARDLAEEHRLAYLGRPGVLAGDGPEG